MATLAFMLDNRIRFFGLVPHPVLIVHPVYKKDDHTLPRPKIWNEGIMVDRKHFWCCIWKSTSRYFVSPSSPQLSSTLSIGHVLLFEAF